MAAKENTKAAVPFEIVVDDGTVRVPIKNTYGKEIGAFAFRPTDTGLLERYQEAISHLDDVVEPLRNAQINPDGTADEDIDGALEAVLEAQERLYALCDKMFDGNMSEAFFSGMRPFSPIGGRFYCEIALENLGKFIAAQFDAENEKISKRVVDYTAKYAKQKAAGKAGE